MLWSVPLVFEFSDTLLAQRANPVGHVITIGSPAETTAGLLLQMTALAFKENHSDESEMLLTDRTLPANDGLW